MKRRKIQIGVLCIACIMMVLSSCGNSSSRSSAENSSSAIKVTELKFDMPVPITSSWGVGAQRFSELLAEKTAGKYQLKIFPNSQLAGGSQAQALQMLQAGDIDVTIHGSLTWAGGNVRIAMPSMPWLFNNWEDAEAAINGDGGKFLAQIIRETGAEPLAFGISGYRQLFNNIRPVRTPADLRGLKIRVPGNALYIDLFKALGADPIAMNASELYTALQQGAVDGQENPADMTITQKFCEVLKYMSVWSYSCEWTILSVSSKLWTNLTDEEKNIFAAASKTAMGEQIVAARERDDGYMKQLVDEYKIQVVRLTPEEIMVFRNMAKPIYDQYRNTMGDELYKAFGVN
jgi:tripartite ATP-independent transporter DctP family solute receptor